MTGSEHDSARLGLLDATHRENDGTFGRGNFASKGNGSDCRNECNSSRAMLLLAD